MSARLASLLILWLVLGGCQDAEPERAAPTQTPAPARFTLETTRLDVRELVEVYPVPGEVVSAHEAWIAPRSTGFVEQITVSEGERVVAGQLLAVIDSTAVEAQIVAAQATLAAANAERLDAAGDVRRFQRLARTQAVAEDRLLDARVREAQADAAVKTAAAQLQRHTEERRYTRLESPADAQVRERLADPGDLATAGKALLHLDVLGALELEIHLPSARAALLRSGDAVEVAIDGAGRVLTGHVEQVVRAADPVTRQCKVRIALPPDPAVIPGAFGHARLRLPPRSLRFVPAAALTRRAAIDGVFVVDADGRVGFRSVRLGRAWPGNATRSRSDGHELLAGPPPGSRVVIDPPDRLKDGDQRVADSPGDGR